MSNAKHTPGPWLRDEKSGADCDVRAATGRKVALCWGLGCGDNYRAAYKAECDANAHLIAASPELLAAAEEMADLLDNLLRIGAINKDLIIAESIRNVLPIHRAAIAKAGGV